MVEMNEVFETIDMVSHENLDVRTITMGIRLLDCIDPDLDRLCEKIYNKTTESAKDLVKVGDEIGLEYGVPVINKRISITPAALIGGAACKNPDDFVRIAETLDKAAKKVGVNFIGGYSARSVFAHPSAWDRPGQGSTWMRSGSWETSSSKQPR